TSEDCNGNFIPDECDIDPSLPMYNMGPPSVGPECPPDWDDIGGYYTLKGGGSLDTDTNGVPDECQEDCNNNGTLDWCELDCDHVLCHPDGFPDLPGCGQADDCNGNNTPDDCEEDCNDNGVSDLCDITAGTSLDDNTNGAPDECDPDCDGNGTPDDIDMIVTPGYDCNTNGVLDRCEHTFPDCNGDDIEDACDIAAGTSLDGNGNGTPDECEPQPDIALESSLPDCDDSLWRCSNNFIRLTFDGEITDPSGAIQIRTLESGGTYGATDYSSNFTFTVVDDGFGTMRVLEIQENGSSFSSLLPDTTWIGVYAEPGAWFGVQGFSMHYMVQAGDVNNDGNVNFSGDAGLVYAHVGETGVPDETRWDLNGDHNVNFSGDAGCVYLHVGATPVPKPTGHVCP
ncbi:MAG: hypothetical protein GY842_22995, partial [bacterium]|nr:hypothetical protein [bacterium]